jgi:hypothetical protein
MNPRQPLQRFAYERRLGESHWRPHHPLRRPYEMADALCLRLQGGHDLHARRSRSDDSDATPVRHDVVVPAGGVDDVTVEGI